MGFDEGIKFEKITSVTNSVIDLSGEEDATILFILEGGAR